MVSNGTLRACLDTLCSDACWSAAADVRIEIFAAFLDSPDAVQNLAIIQSGGLQKRRRREAFGVIFSDSRVSPSVIVKKAYPNSPFSSAYTIRPGQFVHKMNQRPAVGQNSLIALL
jgi:hypothetical protein